MADQTRTPQMIAPTRDTHGTWTVNNPIMPEGVLCVTKDRQYPGSVEYFMGDGTHTYTELAKFGCFKGADEKIPIDDLPVGAAGGVAGLDANKKVPAANLPIGEASGIAGLDADKKIKAADLPKITAAMLAETYIKTDAKNAAGGVAGLDASGKLAVTQLPTKILTAEPTAADLAENEVAYVVEA